MIGLANNLHETSNERKQTDERKQVLLVLRAVRRNSLFWTKKGEHDWKSSGQSSLRWPMICQSIPRSLHCLFLCYLAVMSESHRRKSST